MSDFSRKLEAEIPALRRYARYLTRDADRADDLVQDSLERAIAKRRLWHQPENLRAWLFALQRNVYLNQLRRLARRPAEVPMDQVFGESGQGEAQTDRLMAREVLMALETLEPEQREVLVLVVVEGLLYKEVATVLGLPAGTVMSRLSRGRAQLRKTLTGDSPNTTSTLWRVK
jgi:RNA polymerase sigma-70 factor, ECF subfamily